MKKIIRQLLLDEEYEKANQYLSEHIDENNYDDDIAFFDAVIGLYYGDESRVWNACANGLALNGKNYELYTILGEYYFSFNINQAYLYYENALYYCTEEEDRKKIWDRLELMREKYPVTVRKVSIILLSYNLLEYTRECIESIRNTTSEAMREIIVVDNASEDNSVEWLRKQKDIILIENKVNTGFPRGCNQGIEKANQENDIFLLNNDTVILENSLFWLRMGLYENEKIGATGSRSNVVSNLQQVLADKRMSMGDWITFGRMNNSPMEYPYEEKLYLVGFALLIKREVVNLIGGLDECFTPGNFEDNDYGLRIIKAGYKNILCRNSFIFHYGSKSFGKNIVEFQNTLDINGEKFRKKWNIDPYSYSNPRAELLELIEKKDDEEFKFLEIGCGCGATLKFIRGLYPNVKVFGVENNKEEMEIAALTDTVICTGIEEVFLPWEENFFDYILMGDLLQKTNHPEELMFMLRRYLKPNGKLLISIPNVKHFSVMMPLLFKDELTYGDGGILDKESRRLYTGTEIKVLLENTGFIIREIHYTRKGEAGEIIEKVIDQLMAMTGSSNRSPYEVYKYLIKAEPM